MGNDTPKPGADRPERLEAIYIAVPKDLADLVPAYLEARRRDAEQAAVLLTKGDFAGLIKIAHNMAGSGASYGFQRLSDLGAMLEKAARSGEKDASKTHLDALRDHLNRIKLS